MTETVMLRPHAVRAMLRATSFDASDNTIEVVWTTGAAVQRYDWDGAYTETLLVTPKAVRLGRMNGGVPFLNAHGSWDLADIIGRTVPGSAVLSGGEGTCRVALSTDPAKAGIVADIRAGIIADVSVGYIVHQMTRTEAQDGQTASCLVTDWEPIEISAVPIPADPDAKVRSSPTTVAAERGETHPCAVTRAAPSTAVTAAPQASPVPAPADPAAAARSAETARVQGILRAARQLGSPEDLSDRAIADGTGLDAFRALAIDARGAAATAAPTSSLPALPAARHQETAMDPNAVVDPVTRSAPAATLDAATIRAAEIAARAAETARVQGIMVTARKLNLPSEDWDRAIADGTDLNAFREWAIDEAAKRQTPASWTSPPAAGAEHRTYADAAKPVLPGTNAVRCLIALAATRGIAQHAAAFVAERYGRGGEVAARALGVSAGATGGFLIPPDMAAEVIELLRPASTVMALQPEIVPMPRGQIFIPRQSSGSQASYVGENQPAGASQPGFGGIQLSAKKLVTLVPISNDMIRFAGPATDGIVRNDMIRAIAQRGDLAFLRGNGGQFSPRGFRSFAAEASLGGLNLIAANPQVNLQNVVNDLGKLELALEQANIVMERPGWVMSPRTKTYLQNLRDGLGNPIYEKEMLTGMLRGKPFKVTTQIPNNLASVAPDGATQLVDGSEIYLADFAQVVIGEVEGLEIATFEGGAYLDANGVLQSGISNDQTVMRTIVQHDMGMRQEAAVAVLIGVRWF